MQMLYIEKYLTLTKQCGFLSTKTGEKIGEIMKRVNDYGCVLKIKLPVR